MKDVTILLEHRPGALAEMGEALGSAGISVEGGGGWLANEQGLMHFLFASDAPVEEVLTKAGITVVATQEVLVQRLKQDVPGQLGMIARRMADAGVNIETIYSDHDHRLILVVDDFAKGKQVSEAWQSEFN